MTKKVLITIVDTDSGEFLYQPRDFNKGGVPLTFCIHDGAFTGEDAIKRVYDSFVRGIRRDRNLQLTITIKPYEPVEELPLFPSDGVTIF